MASSTSPFTYGAVEVIFGSIYFYFHLQTAPDLQDCPHSTNLPTIPESTLSKPPSLNMTNVTKLALENIYGENHEECTYFWTPFTDKYSEGNFVDELTNETIGYIHF